MATDDCSRPFDLTYDETLVLAANLLMTRAPYERAASLYASDLLELRQAARVIERSKQTSS
jgi:hypothetical protein